MPRLFTGLEIPQLHRTTLSLLQHSVPKGANGIFRWIEPSDFHITLRFIGDVTPRQADEIVDALSWKQRKAPRIEIRDLASFGGTKPKSVHVTIADNPALTSLASSHERIMQNLGFPADGRNFIPHITLARCRGATVEQVAAWLRNAAGPLRLPAFIPSRFALYSARESRGGGPYIVEEIFPLTLPEETLRT